MTDLCYVFAVAASGIRVPAAPGIDDAPLFAIPVKDVEAIVCSVTQESFPASPEAVLRHEAVVEAVRDQGPAIPVRFGTVLPGVEAVSRLLDERNKVLAADVGRLGDKGEFGLTALWRDPIGGDQGSAEGPDEERISPGDYLRTWFATYRREDAARERARALAHELGQQLAVYALDSRVRILAGDRLALRAAYLVALSGSEAFRQAFDESRRAHPECRFLLSGPWPPYSFVASSAAGGHTGRDLASTLLRGTGVAQ